MCCSGLLSQPRNVFGRGIPEIPSILSGELRCALVAHPSTCRSSIRHGQQHEAPRFLEAQGLLVLQRAQRRDRLEMLMERGWAHVDHGRQPFHVQGLVEMGADPRRTEFRGDGSAAAWFRGLR